jgi:hypothetical protein
MKKTNRIKLKLLLVGLFLGLFNVINAQVDFYINEQSNLVPGPITVQIRISCPTVKILGYSVDISFDKNVMTCISTNVTAIKHFPTTNASDWVINNAVNPNGIRLEYNDVTQTAYFYPTNTLVCELSFIYNGGNTAITAIASGDGFFDEGWGTVPSIFHSGFSNGNKVPITSKVSGGLWNSSLTWSPGNIPNSSANSEIFISSNHSTPVVIDANVSTDLNLTINSGAALTVNLGKSLSVAGNFLIKDGGSFVNYGTSTQTAIAERYIAKDNSWHFLSSPVDAQLIKPNFAPNTVDLTFDFFKWDEGTSVVYPSLPWINIRATNSSYATGFDNFENGRGYLVAYSSAYGGNATHEFNGTLNNGDKSINVGYSVNYFNLVGNPYASAIDWDAAGYTNRDNVLENTDPSIWIWNNTNGNYGTYKKNVAGTNGVTNIIAPHQAYFVQSKAAGTYTTPNTARVHPGTQNFLKSTPNDLLRLKVNSSANNYSDEIIVNFNSNAATNEGVGKWYSMLADAPSLYSVKNNKNLSINTFPSISNNMVIPVSFIAGINGTYNINASELNSFAANTYIYLKDLKTNFIQDLNQNATYSFVGLTTDNTERFQILFAFSPLNISNQLVNNSNIYTFENTVYINSNETINQILVFNALGQLIKEINKTDNVNSFSMNGFPTAYYIVKVITDKSVSSEKIFVK